MKTTLSQTQWRWLAVTGPLLLPIWAFAPRVATNRPSYIVRELLMFATVALAAPSVYAIGRLISHRRSAVALEASRVNWLPSTILALWAFVLVDVAKGDVPGVYGDDNIPGLASGFWSAVLAVVLTLVAWVRAGFHAVGRHREAAAERKARARRPLA